MNPVLKEAKRLYDLGFAILWIKPKSKAPVKSKWTTGPREEWKALQTSFKPGMNVGVRLGAPSKIDGKYLAVIDIDVKSTDAAHRLQAEKAVRELFPEIPADVIQVLSGRGNGSSHIYVLTTSPSAPMKARVSPETVKVMMPSAAVNAKQKEQLSTEDLNEGWRIRPAWEIAIMGEGQQVLLPPSIHPDSGKEYVWKTGLDHGFVTLELRGKDKGRERTATADWEPVDVEVFGSKLSSRAIDIICDADVEDRSAALFSVTIEMVKAGWSDHEIMSVLTDPAYALGKVSYEHAKTDSRKRAANWVFNYTIKKARAENDARIQFQLEVEEIPLDAEAASKQAAELISTPDWRLQLDRTQTGISAGRPQNSLKNLLLILANDIGPGIFQRDEFANRDRYGCDTPWGGKIGNELSDDDVIQIKVWCMNRFRFEPDDKRIIDAIKSLALQNSFHPVRHYLLSLEWDGKPRVDTWIKKFIQGKGPEPYLTDVSRKILLAMIARVFVPGIKFDYIPILEGKQGVGKSSAAKILASPEWFMDNIPDLRDKDSRLNLQGKWVIEMGELSKLKTSDLETLKAYIVSPVDRVRSPYGKLSYDLKRQSVFIGTTNESVYLKDKTGNRRFWPVAVGQCDFDGLQAARDQLFAEAMLIWENFRENLYLEGEAKTQAEAVQEDRVHEDDESTIEELITQFFEAERLKNGDATFNLNGFTMRDLFNQPPLVNSFPLKNPYSNYAGRVLKRLGFSRFKSGNFKKWRESETGVPR